MRRTILQFLVFAIIVTISCRNRPATLTISAAADLTPAFEEIGQKFTEETGKRVVFNFGSSGQLAQQIEKGAPVDLFASANNAYVEELEKKGLILAETKAIYAQGRITIWTRADSTLGLKRLEDLTRSEVHRIAIANPEHAPYGMAAREAMQSAGIWDQIKPKLVYGENIAQTLQYGETGNVDAAIVALSLSVRSHGHWTLIPEGLHQPLLQSLAVIKGSANESTARQFAAFVNSREGRAIMRRFGFVLPGEELRR